MLMLRWCHDGIILFLVILRYILPTELEKVGQIPKLQFPPYTHTSLVPRPLANKNSKLQGFRESGTHEYDHVSM